MHTYLSEMSLPRSFVAAAPIKLSSGGGTGVVVAGGMTYKNGVVGDNWEGTSLVEIYDVGQDQWTTSDSIPFQTW